MAPRYNPTPDERRALEALAEEVAGVQRTFVANHPGLAQPDRGAHQPQLGGGKVLLQVNDTLPPSSPASASSCRPARRPASASAACRTASGARTPKPTPTSSD